MSLLHIQSTRRGIICSLIAVLRIGGGAAQRADELRADSQLFRDRIAYRVEAPGLIAVLMSLQWCGSLPATAAGSARTQGRGTLRR